MSENVLMLALSPTMEEGVIVKWVKAKGDSVAEGDVICEIETDKATMEYESSVEGVLLDIVVGEGESAAIGDTIAVIGEQGEEVEGVGETITEAPADTPSEPEQAVDEEVSETTVVETVSAEPVSTSVKSSPLARNVAKESGVDINEIKGSGPGGRIVEADVKAVSKDSGSAKQVAEAPVPGLSEEIIEVSAKRKLIADTLAGSKFTSPHYYLKVDVIANNLMQRRINFNAVRETKVSLNAFIIKYVAMALERHPIVNSSWQGDKILQHGRADIALAVSQADGLIAPVVRQCQTKDVVQIDTELKALIAKTRAGTLTSADYANSTFTITNLGSMGIDEFTAIINPPNSAILAIGKISKKLIVSAEDDIQIRKCMTMTLSCDHRLIDGATGAGFLSGLRDIMEGVS